MMNSNDPGKTRQVINPKQAMRFGGAILLFGVLLTLLTIGFEVRIGWVALLDDEATLGDLAAFMQTHWGSLRWIWAGQMAGTCLTALAALLLLQGLHLQNRWLSTSILWSVVVICAILVAAALGLALGSYPPAFAAFEQSPELFKTTRTGVRFLYDAAGLGQYIAIFIIFLWEGFAQRGVLPRSWMAGTLAVLFLAIVAAIGGFLAPQMAGAAVFLIPGILGLAYWRWQGTT